MFGISFGEAVFLVIIAIVVIGPRDLPKMMRSLGQTISRLRRAATDLRTQSGIDEILHNEGIHREVQDLQKLATGRILDLGLDEPLLPPTFGAGVVPQRPPVSADDAPENPYQARRSPPRNREYPAGGPDAFEALPEDAYPADAPGPSTDEAAGTPPTGAVARGALPPDDDETQAA